MERTRNLTVHGLCGEVYLELGEDTVPRTIWSIFFKGIGSNPITYNNTFHLRYWLLISESQVNYAEYIVITIYMDNLGMSSKDLIQVISYIVQANLYV